jgi:hypothetical protein
MFFFLEKERKKFFRNIGKPLFLLLEDLRSFFFGKKINP